MKRFVSYLYSIHNNQKIHNAGFARIELRTGRNRIDIHMRENGYSGKTGTVYLFIRRQENIQGIAIGNIIFRNNQADFRYEQAEENIGQTPWQIMQMNGILIIVDDRAAFLSQWDEQSVDTARFEIWEAGENVLEENGDADHTISRNNGTIQRQAVGSAQEEAVKETLNTGNKSVEEKNGIHDDNDHGIEQNESDGMEKRKSMATESGKNNISAFGQPEVQPAKVKEQMETEKEAVYEQPELEEQAAATENKVHEGQVSDIRTAELQPQPVSQWTQTWRNMLRTFPVLNQFEKNDNILCVRIEIKDVRLLPEKYWSMINNSFLLHGFFNYRYLVFGRIGQNWFIGIPGIYQNQEHAMASIFGFPDFLPQEKKNEQGEQPGYWYRILEIQ